MNTRARQLIMVILLILCHGTLVQSQTRVGLDAWYNHETSKTTGQPYHYLWTDTAMSGFSRWGEIFRAQGAVIVQEEKSPTALTLRKLDIYIIVDPDTTSENPSPHYITSRDVRIIERWVKKGGVLVLLGNDAPNCEFTHLNRLSGRSGILFNPVTLHRVTGNDPETAASGNLPIHPLFQGVNKIFMKEVSSLSLKPPAKAVLTENGSVLIAESRIGKGMVFAIGDPWIYNEYIDHERLPRDISNHEAAVNFSLYLIGQTRKKHWH